MRSVSANGKWPHGIYSDKFMTNAETTLSLAQSVGLWTCAQDAWTFIAMVQYGKGVSSHWACNYKNKMASWAWTQRREGKLRPCLVCFFSSLNIFHTICGFHTYHSVQHFFFFLVPKLTEPSEKKKETQNRLNQWKKKEKKKRNPE